MQATRVVMAICAFALGSCNQRFGDTIVNQNVVVERVVYGGELRLARPHRAVVDGESRIEVGFPLRHTAVTADVAGMMAIYEIEQTFDNPYDEALEAQYVFPLGDKGAVSGYEITIGERTIVGEIQPRALARRTYEEAKSAGYTTALVEQHKPNIFAQSIANIAPHETVRVKLTYVDLLQHRDNAYELVVPLVVGPRYQPAEGSTHPTPQIDYVHPMRASSTVSFTAHIDAGLPIRGITSPSHRLAVRDIAPTRAEVMLAETGEIPNRDLVIRFGTADQQTQAGVLAHRQGREDGYFVLTVQPKAEYVPGDIREREVLLVIDRSGSMEGEPLEQAKAIAGMIVDTLTPGDTFNIIGFASGVSAMADDMVAGDPDGRRRGRDYLAGMRAGGGTEMAGGVRAMLADSPGDRVRVIYFLTDGWVGNDDTVLSAARSMLGSNRIMPVGIGSAPNRYLLDRLAKVGRGFASYVTAADPPEEIGRDLVVHSTKPYMTEVEIDWGDLAVRDVDPEIVPDIYAGQPLVVSGRYRPSAGTVRISATVHGRRVVIPATVELPEQRELEPVASLWARRRIETLTSDFACESEYYARERHRCKIAPESRAEIEALGLHFHLLTELTSFVAVDHSRVVSADGTRTVRQPVIAPEGSEHMAQEPPPPPQQQQSHRRRSSSWSDGNSGGLFSGGPAEDRRALLGFAACCLVVLAWWIARRRRPDQA